MAWIPESIEIFENMKVSILSSPLLARYDPEKLTFIKTDWSAEGMGYILMQPVDNTISTATSKYLQAGGPCTFDISKSGAQLLPICFGSRECTGLEKKYYSFFGKVACVR